MPGYTWDQTNDQFTAENQDQKPVRRGCSIRHKIETLKFDKNEFIALSSIEDPFLGVHDE